MNLFTLFSDLKAFFCSTLNAFCIFILIINIVILGFLVKLNNDIKNINTEIKMNRDKLNFRYFNLTQSLEDIHKIKIDTKTGKIEH